MHRLLQLLDGFDAEAPFTMQRLAEVLLEPRKQYTRLEKLVPPWTSDALYLPNPNFPGCLIKSSLSQAKHCKLYVATGCTCVQLNPDCTVQALALEKLLLVTSTVPQTSQPPPQPKLSGLPAVNENPLTPAVPPSSKGALGSAASPHTNRASDRPQCPASGFGVAGAVLGTLTAGAASQFLPGTQVSTLMRMRM